MTEQFPGAPIEGEPESVKSPHFDPQIDDAMSKLLAENFTREKQKEASNKDDRGDRVDFVCWELASTPETLMKSVNLRALYTMRQLDVATRELTAGESWNYHVYVEDPFWRKVDEAMIALLHKNADKMYHDSQISEGKMGEEDLAVYSSEQNIAEMNGRLIRRRAFRRGENAQPHHVIYTVVAEDE